MTKVVYIVTEVCDYEYGCTEISGVFSTHELAEKYVNSQPDGDEIIKFWDGHTQSRYAIDAWKVDNI